MMLVEERIDRTHESNLGPDTKADTFRNAPHSMVFNTSTKTPIMKNIENIGFTAHVIWLQYMTFKIQRSIFIYIHYGVINQTWPRFIYLSLYDPSRAPYSTVQFIRHKNDIFK